MTLDITWSSDIGSDSMGAMAPQPKSCAGDASMWPPQEFCQLMFFWKQENESIFAQASYSRCTQPRWTVKITNMSLCK